ncbi:HIT family protein [Paenisporosarcina cavernae]|uniref:HIT family protein n=1 Tax=Paenisporosarcina cavernae TaxID=2320858 RepID=A0A385YTK1_9BACL|nr:HIT family protein [Paenisporosarcina cavernae]AYC30169.1 HIT family protein [Paenisporosarcina cavernae]
MTECLFCKLVDGSIPATKVYEDDKVLAFMDIMPLTKGHTLLIPKAHHASIQEMPPEEAAHLFSVAPKIARAIEDAFEPHGLNLLNNNGAPAGQSVFHFHLHFIPRYNEKDGLKVSWKTKEKEFSMDDFAEHAKEIQAKLS